MTIPMSQMRELSPGRVGHLSRVTLPGNSPACSSRIWPSTALLLQARRSLPCDLCALWGAWKAERRTSSALHAAEAEGGGWAMLGWGGARPDTEPLCPGGQRSWTCPPPLHRDLPLGRRRS